MKVVASASTSAIVPRRADCTRSLLLNIVAYVRCMTNQKLISNEADVAFLHNRLASMLIVFFFSSFDCKPGTHSATDLRSLIVRLQPVFNKRSVSSTHTRSPWRLSDVLFPEPVLQERHWLQKQKAQNFDAAGVRRELMASRRLKECTKVEKGHRQHSEKDKEQQLQKPT